MQSVEVEPLLALVAAVSCEDRWLLKLEYG